MSPEFVVTGILGVVAIVSLVYSAIQVREARNPPRANGGTGVVQAILDDERIVRGEWRSMVESNQREQATRIEHLEAHVEHCTNQTESLSQQVVLLGRALDDCLNAQPRTYPEYADDRTQDSPGV